jgi:segregation and condensation protein A
MQIGDANFSIEARGRFRNEDAKDYIPNPESEQLRIDVPDYEGPLDLLLHLIKKHSIDIFDIPIGLITQKYLEEIDWMKELNLDVAGEFLLMAATLAQIKSRMLLPPDEQAAISSEEDEGVDPRAELVRRLLEYQKFKEAAAHLGSRDQLGADVFLRPQIEDFQVAFGLVPESEEPSFGVAPVESFELIHLFSKVLERAMPKVSHQVQIEKIGLRARISELIDFSRLRALFEFNDALKYFGAKTKIDLIVTFLAILEMAKMRLLTIEQVAGMRTIRLTAIQENLSIADEDLLADLQDDLANDVN